MTDRDLGSVSKRDASRLPLAAKAGMIAGLGIGTLGVIACGARVEKNPEPTNTLVPQPTATESFTPTPEVTSTPVPLSAEAREILRDIDGIFTWNTPTFLEALEKFNSDLQENGEDPEDYIQLYTYVEYDYCRPINRDGAMIPLMDKIEAVIKKKWSDIHSSLQADGFFIRLEPQVGYCG